MCTCINVYHNNNSYFLRNMDVDFSFNEKLIVTPRNYEIKFKKEKSIKEHYAFMGIGTVINNYPLYAEGCNEKGISIAGLNFPINCYYYKVNKDKSNYTPYEFLLIILATCKNMKEVRHLLDKINIIDINFSKDVKLTPLHFMISYRNESIVVECMKDKMYVYENKYNIMTNNPPFFYHENNTLNYIQLHNGKPTNNLNQDNDSKPFCQGLGAVGLPGDYSSPSRFIKGLFVKKYLELTDSYNKNIIQFFKCLDSTSMIKGNVKSEYGFEYTRYSCVIDTKNLIYYYKTYYGTNVSYLDLKKEKIKQSELITYKLDDETIFKKNR